MSCKTQNPDDFTRGWNYGRETGVELSPREIIERFADVDPELLAQGMLDGICGDRFRLDGPPAIGRLGRLTVTEKSLRAIALSGDFASPFDVFTEHATSYWDALPNGDRFTSRELFPLERMYDSTSRGYRSGWLSMTVRHPIVM